MPFLLPQPQTRTQALWVREPDQSPSRREVNAGQVHLPPQAPGGSGSHGERGLRPCKDRGWACTVLFGLTRPVRSEALLFPPCSQDSRCSPGCARGRPLASVSRSSVIYFPSPCAHTRRDRTGRGCQQPGTRDPARGPSTLPAANIPQSGFRARDPGPRAGRQVNVTSGAETLSSPGRGPGLGSQRTHRVSGCKHNTGRGGRSPGPQRGCAPGIGGWGTTRVPPGPRLRAPTQTPAPLRWSGLDIFSQACPSLLPLGGGPWLPPKSGPAGHTYWHRAVG